MYYVYILKSKKDAKLYKGFTNDLRRRIREHNSGKSTFTSKSGPWELLYYEAFKDKVDAKREEQFLKSGKGRERTKHLFRDQQMETWLSGRKRLTANEVGSKSSHWFESSRLRQEN